MHRITYEDENNKTRCHTYMNKKERIEKHPKRYKIK